MQVFQKNIIVTQADLDQLNHVNNVRYVQWVQYIAEAHWLQNATTKLLNTYFWVLLEHHIHYKNQAVLGDELSVTTYVSKSEGVTSLRHVKISNTSTLKDIVISETKWCFMSKATKRPSRITDEVANLFD